MIMRCVKQTSLMNLIYSGQQPFSYTGMEACIPEVGYVKITL
jgi:hypothetical protein